MTSTLETGETIRVLIADDHPLVREGLRALIGKAPGMKIVSEAADGVEAVAQARSLRPDVILLDVQMPRMDGITAIGEIMSENPEAYILVLTGYADDENVFRAIKAGALGYLLKDSSPHELLQAIHEVCLGESFLPPPIARKLLRELRPSAAHPPGLAPAQDALTEREGEVLQFMAQGLLSQEIADKLGVSKRAVHVYVRNIREKLLMATRR